MTGAAVDCLALALLGLGCIAYAVARMVRGERRVIQPDKWAEHVDQALALAELEPVSEYEIKALADLRADLNEWGQG